MKLFLIALIVLTLFTTINAQEDFVLQQQAIEFQQIPVQQPVQTPNKQTINPTPNTRAPFVPNYKFDMATLQALRYQILGISLILFYLILYIQGKNKNLTIMQNFYRKVDRYLENNFAHIGFTKVSGQAPFNGQSPSQSLYYATGRENIDGIEMRFNTKKRHDLIYSLYDIIFPQKDIVTIDIPVKTDVMLVLAVASKKKIKEMTQSFLDIRKIAGKFGIKGLNDHYQVLGEASDTVDNLIDNYTIKRLNDFQGLFISIHYTDLKIYSTSSGHLRVVLNTAHKNKDHFLPALQLILYLADKIATLKLSSNSKSKAQKARQVYSQLKEKEDLQKHNEELRKKKQQKLRQQQVWLRSLPPERQKRQEQKRKKKQFNKLFKGKTMKM